MSRTVLRGHNKLMTQAGAQTSVLDVVLDAASAAWRTYYGKTAHGIGEITFKLSREMFDRAVLTAADRAKAGTLAISLFKEPNRPYRLELQHDDGFLLRLEAAS